MDLDSEAGLAIEDSGDMEKHQFIVGSRNIIVFLEMVDFSKSLSQNKLDRS